MDIRQLILIRQFYSEARLTPAGETPFLRIKRTLHLDLCAELALNVVVRDFGTTKEQDQQGGRRDLSRDLLWDLAAAVVERKVAKTLPERQALKTLHELRNLAQHRGTAPSADAVRGAVDPVRGLLEFICREIYSLDFEHLREWDVLEHESLRHWLDDCQELLERGQAFLTAAACQLVFTRIQECIRNAAAGPNATAPLRQMVRVPHSELADAINGLVGAIQESVFSLEAELVAVSLGLPVTDHFRFLRISRGVVITESISGNWDAAMSRMWPADDEDARSSTAFMVEYLGRASVLLESAHPGIFRDLRLPTRVRDSRHWAEAFGAVSPFDETSEKNPAAPKAD